MDSKLGNTGVTVIDVRFVARYPRVLVSILLMAAVILASLVLFQPAPLVDLSAPGVLDKSGLLTHWSKGDIIVLVRHAERCDHSTNPCLGATDGITLKGSKVATQLGNNFRRLGLANADVLSSPLARAQQTSQFMFASAVPRATWLFNCRKTMLGDTLAHKNSGRNLVLVTHSECFDAFEKQMKIPDAPALGFGAALFFSVDAATGKPKMLGFIEETDWQNLPGFALPVSTQN